MLAIRQLKKSFGRTRALHAVDLDVAPGEIMAVVGENGAGKSTLMQILAGAIAQDAGTLHLDGQLYRPRSPAAALSAGVAIVPQEAELVGDLSVAENIMLGRQPVRYGFVRQAETLKCAVAALAEVTTDDQTIDPLGSARELGPSERQRVVIARAISQPRLRVLIFDEPTSSLSARDVERLFEVLRRLKQRNLAVLYVSHFLEEVLAIADRYTVIRDGRSVATDKISDATGSGLVSLMTGEPAQQREPRPPRKRGSVVLDVQRLSGIDLPIEVSLQLHAGEVLGIAGLVGAGRSELLRSIFGLTPVRDGQLRVGSFGGPFAPKSCLEHGLGLLSEDRRHEGLAQRLSIAENITLSKIPTRGPLVRRAEQQHAAAAWIERLGIRCESPTQIVAELSGGNQQKVALARLLHHDIDILLLDEPTRGIDVRSRADVHACIDELVRRGKSVLLVSSYLPELLALSDRIAVMCRGRLGPARPVDTCNEHTLLMQATGTG